MLISICDNLICIQAVTSALTHPISLTVAAIMILVVGVFMGRMLP